MKTISSYFTITVRGSLPEKTFFHQAGYRLSKFMHVFKADRSKNNFDKENGM